MGQVAADNQRVPPVSASDLPEGAADPTRRRAAIQAVPAIQRSSRSSQQPQASPGTLNGRATSGCAVWGAFRGPAPTSSIAVGGGLWFGSRRGRL